MSQRSEALSKRLKAIPDGRVSDTARRAKITLRHLMRLRKGDSASAGLATLEALADALGESVGSLLGEGPQQQRPVQPNETVNARAVRRLLKRIEAVADDARKVAASLPDGNE